MRISDFGFKIEDGSPVLTQVSSTPPIAKPRQQQSRAGGDLRYASRVCAALRTFEGDAVEAPHISEGLVGHLCLAEDWVGDCNGLIANFQDCDAVVEHKGVFDDGEGNVGLAELTDRVEMAELTAQAICGVAVLNCFVETPG